MGKITRQRSPAKRKHASIARQKPKLKRMAKGKYNGKPVFDAKAPLVVKISKADIVKSSVGDPDNCAAAIALVRQQPIMAAHVYRSRVFVELRDRVVRYITPARLRQETISFDRGTPGRFMEGDYRLLPPTGQLKLGGEHRTGRKGGHSKTLVTHMPVAGARPSSTGHWQYMKGTKA